MNIKFSIITINYNNAQGLVDTIKSVIEQDYKNFEYIIIDGGSTDGSVEVLAQYQNYIDYSLSEKDKGVYHAMNKGICVAKGDYIIFMNSGDSFYTSNTLSTYASHIVDSIGVYYGHSSCTNAPHGITSLIQPVRLNLSFWLFNGINHQASAIRRDLFDLYGLYNEESKITADWQFFVKLNLIHQVSYKHIDDILCKYDMSGMSSDPAFGQLHLEERENFIKNELPQFWEEYLQLQDIRHPKPIGKREKDFYHIQKHAIAYRLLKSFMDILLIFTSKRNDL